MTDVTGVTRPGPARNSEPTLRVVRGAPADEDLGALVAALLAVLRRPGGAEPGDEREPGADVRSYTAFAVPTYAAPGSWARSETAVSLPWR